MLTKKPLLEDLLGREDIRDAAAGRIASAIASWPNVASSMVASAAVASAAVASPMVASSMAQVNSAVAAASQLPGTATGFASAVASRLGFASGVGTADILSALTSRVASALGGMPEFAGRPEVASEVSALVASAVSNRIMTSSDAATMLSTRVAQSTSSAPGKPLSPRKSVDD